MIVGHPCGGVEDVMRQEGRGNPRRQPPQPLEPRCRPSVRHPEGKPRCQYWRLRDGTFHQCEHAAQRVFGLRRPRCRLREARADRRAQESEDRGAGHRREDAARNVPRTPGGTSGAGSSVRSLEGKGTRDIHRAGRAALLRGRDARRARRGPDDPRREVKIPSVAHGHHSETLRHGQGR